MTASVAVAVSAICGAKVAKAEMESVAVADSSTDEAKKFPAVAANGACAKAEIPKVIQRVEVVEVLDPWLPFGLPQSVGTPLCMGVYPSTARCRSQGWLRV